MRVEQWHLPGRAKPQDRALGSGRVWPGVRAVNWETRVDVMPQTGPRRGGPGHGDGKACLWDMGILWGMLLNLRPAHPARGFLPAVRTPGISEQVGDEPVG